LVAHGQTFHFGSVELQVLETPGHTPNSVSLVLIDHGRSDDVLGLLTGDLLFVGDIGRPDLAGEDLLEEQVANLYKSLYDTLGRFPERIEVYPAHGQGSLCGKGMSAKPMTTLGFERRNNPLLHSMEFDEFREIMTGDFQVRPANFAAIVEKNRRGPALLGETPVFRKLTVREASTARNKGAAMVDIRSQTSFGAAFIPGSVNIGLTPNSVNWLGMTVDADRDVVIVADRAEDARSAAHQFRRAGYDRIIGYLDQGVTDWAAQALPLDHLPQLTPESLEHVLEKYKDHVVLDVRTDTEWQSGHIEGALHQPISDLVREGVDLHKARHITTVCRSGYRSNIAGSFLKAAGFTHVFSMIGGMTAWNRRARDAGA
jgi:rhodanese-related sulfurtransferase